MILPGMKIGIIGGGQLGKMLAMAANAMGYYVITLDPQPDAPAASVSHQHLIGALDDETALEQLVQLADVVTYEFENIDADCIERLQNTYKNIPQGAKPLYLSQHRIREKAALVEAGLKVVPYEITTDIESDITQIIKTLDFPFVIKTVEGGYDGKGQAVIHTQQELTAIEGFKQQACVVEKYINYDTECSIIATRGMDGSFQTFPIAENIHHHNILAKSIIEAHHFPHRIEKTVQQMIQQFMEYHQIFGILAMEFFIQKGEVFVNEIAPRPHNSGHYTCEGCATSQFEQQIRVICGLPQGSSALNGTTYMYNILGQHIESLQNYLLKFPKSAHLHLYGKKGQHVNRKMGHVTFLNPTIRELLEFEEQVVAIKVKEKE